MRTDAGRSAGRWLKSLGVLVVALVLIAASPTVAEAHESRTIAGGNYTVSVGFLNEPAYLGLENGLFVAVTQIGGANQPVEGLQETLQAQVVFGGETMPLTLAPLAGQPGAYVGRFIPTRTGDYTFRIAGTVGDQTIDEEFRSAPNTFDSVQPATAIQFPEPVPTGAELATVLQDAEDDAAGARTLALVGIGAGVGGIVIAALAIVLVGRRRSA